MKEMNGLDLNKSTDNYNFLFILGISLVGLLTVNCISHKFQKDFSNTNKPSKLIVSILASYICIFLSLGFMTLNNILTLGSTNITNTTNSKSVMDTKFQNSKENNYDYANDSALRINMAITGLNFFFYIIFPLVLFYFFEEKKFNEKNLNTQNENNYYSSNNEDLEYFHLENTGINSVQYQTTEMNYLQILKSFTFYITAFISLNILYLILFKTSIFDSSNIKELYFFLPEGFRLYSTLQSDIEILNYLNFIIINILGKLLTLVYLPYGLGKITSLLIDNLKNSHEMKQEFKILNTGFSKNYEIIKQITTQKLMTGKKLSKNEKNILRQCKENQTLLEHKQEILEEKYSKLKACLSYILFPIKFFIIVITIIISLMFLFSKISFLYSSLTLSECGIFCGFFTDKLSISIGLQDIYSYILSQTPKCLSVKNSSFIILAISCFYIYFTISIFFAMKNLGILDIQKLFSKEIFKLKIHWIKTTDIRSDKILSFLFYTIFFILTIIGISEILNLTPSISFYMQNYNKCDIRSIQNIECKFSYFMLFNMKNASNFSLAYIMLLFIEALIIIFSGICIIYMPIKSTLDFFKDKNQEKDNSNNDKENSE